MEKTGAFFFTDSPYRGAALVPGLPGKPEKGRLASVQRRPAKSDGYFANCMHAAAGALGAQSIKKEGKLSFIYFFHIFARFVYLHKSNTPLRKEEGNGNDNKSRMFGNQRFSRFSHV